MEHRAHNRIPMKCQVKIQHPNMGGLIVNSCDISDNGLYVQAEHLENLDIGTIVKAVRDFSVFIVTGGRLNRDERLPAARCL